MRRPYLGPQQIAPGSAALLIESGAEFLFGIRSIVFCVSFALDRRTPADEKRVWRLATMLMALLAIGILLTLPSAYRFK